MKAKNYAATLYIKDSRGPNNISSIFYIQRPTMFGNYQPQISAIHKTL